MKKNAFAAAVMALLTVFAVSCKKEKKTTEETRPVISWEANSNFATCEIIDNMDASINVTAPEGIQEMIIKFTKLPVTLVGLVNQHIAISENRATSKNGNLATMDLINDSSVSEWIRGLNMVVPASIKGSTGCTINFKSLINNLMSNQELENDETISFSLGITDAETQNTTKALSFHYTIGPEITVKDYSFALNVPGKIEEAVLLISSLSTSLNAKLVGPLYEGILGATGVSLDLIGNDTAAAKLSSYGVTSGSKLAGQTKTTVDLSKFISDMMLDELTTDKAFGSHLFTLSIKDALGKSSSRTFTYEYKEK